MIKMVRGCGAVGSASEWHSEGQGFESPQLHQVQKTRAPALEFFCLRPISAANYSFGVGWRWSQMVVCYFDFCEKIQNLPFSGL
jgi:hypothetical protein